MVSVYEILTGTSEETRCNNIYQGGMSLGGTKKPPAKPAIALSTGDILWAKAGRAVMTNIPKAIQVWLMERAIAVI